ncbi:MAG: efflux RND transporter permease subunit [Planctomycetota bacterium]
MRISHFFIDRPIFAGVLSLVTVLVGALAYLGLPVAQYPPVVPPTVVVRAVYPGANAETVGETVATPLEQEINGVEDMLYMESACTNDGTVQVTVTFALGADLDKAQVLVQNRVRIAEARLPEEVRRGGVTTQKQSPDLLLVCNLYSPGAQLTPLYISNYAVLHLRDALARVDGVGSVQLFGAREYSMRVWLDPDRIANLGLTGPEVVQALRAKNVQVAAGSLGQPPAPAGQAFQLVLNTQGRFSSPEEFGAVVVARAADGRVVRVRDVARVELGARDYATNSFLDGEPAVAVVVNQRPGSNALETSQRVLHTLEELGREFPAGLAYRVGYNPTEFIEASVHALQKTIFEAVLLVVLVVVLFLQSWRTALIPLLAIPVSLVGTFAVMGALGFSINTLSLFGLVLAIGIVVDDAIVVVENVERHIAAGLAPREAARRAMDEVGGPVIAIALVLAAVFVPTAFVAGMSGQFYRQFALTIAVATLISAFNSLTLSPALSALLLEPHGVRRDWFGRLWDWALGGFFARFNRGFAAAGEAYAGVVRRLLRAGLIVLAVYLGLLLLTGDLFRRVPTGFVPAVDQGYLIVAIQGPDGSSLERTDATVKRASQLLRETPGIGATVAFSGFSGATRTTTPNAGAIFCPLRPFAEREAQGLSANAILADAQRRLAVLDDAYVVVVPPPPVRGIGTLGGFAFEVQDRAGRGSAALAEATQALVAAANQDPALSRVFSLFRASSPQLYADVDRARAEMLGVPAERVLDTLQTYVGSAYVNDFTVLGRPFRVTAQAEANRRLDPADVARLKTRSDRGAMVPLGSVATIRQVAGPDYVTRYDLHAAAVINGNTAPGASTGQAIEAMERLAREQLPAGFGFEWTGLYYQQILAGNTSLFVFPLCVLFVFLTLAALYESWSLPLAIILIVPLCLLFGIGGVWLRGMDNDVLTQIGFVVLVGLACKNAILIVEFAKEVEDQGGDAQAAAVEAARLRLRPIIMTSLAFILGVLPLVLATGPGAELRRSLGTAVFSGMIGVTVVGLLLTPAFYVLVRRFTARAPADQEAAAEAAGEQAPADQALAADHALKAEQGAA